MSTIKKRKHGKDRRWGKWELLSDTFLKEVAPGQKPAWWEVTGIWESGRWVSLLEGWTESKAVWLKREKHKERHGRWSQRCRHKPGRKGAYELGKPVWMLISVHQKPHQVDEESGKALSRRVAWSSLFEKFALAVVWGQGCKRHKSQSQGAVKCLERPLLPMEMARGGQTWGPGDRTSSCVRERKRRIRGVY